MSYLLFLDESGHDHKNCPYEVHGGIAIHVSKLWPFIRDMQRLEFDTFGLKLSDYKHELKGSHLLDKERFKWSRQGPRMENEERRSACRAFITKGLQKIAPRRHEFTGYGQACLEMVSGLFESLRNHEAVLFAVAIPCTTVKPLEVEHEEILRKDHVFLLERYYYFLEEKKMHGLLVMDETERIQDARLIRRMENYFIKTQTGRLRAQWIVPSPFFVSSDLAYPIQAADICSYCVNWGFRLAKSGMEAPVRTEISEWVNQWLFALQYNGEVEKEGEKFKRYGIAYVPDPYSPRKSIK